MHWIDAFKLAEIHREVYAATLKSWLPHGKREEFARKCGITREYLSCLCALDDPLGDVPIHKRYPSPKTAKRIAANLPASTDIRDSLLENMILANINANNVNINANNVPRSSDGSLRSEEIIQCLSDLRETHREATFGVNAISVRSSYRVVRNASKSLLNQIDPEKHPDSFAQACLYYHDSQCILDRADEALRFAKIAQLVLESVEEIESGFTQEQRDELIMNTIRGEAVAYHNLRLDHKVPNLLKERARSTSAYRNTSKIWAPIINRDLINSLVEIHCFSIREVNKLAIQGEMIGERNGDELMLLLIHEAWIRSLIVHQKWRQAQQIFNEELTRLPHLQHVGALHKVLILKGGALLAWSLRDKESWKAHITEVVNLIREAGLNHQMETIRRCYGSALNPICAGMDLCLQSARGSSDCR